MLRANTNISIFQQKLEMQPQKVLFKYTVSLLIESFMKERKREKENIPLFLCYLNTGENFIVINIQYKAFIVIFHRCPLSLVPYPLKKNVAVPDLPRSEDRVQGHLCKITLKKEWKRKKGTIPLIMFYLNTGENFVVANLQYMGNFRSTEQGENFKSSETWLNLFKIMKKTQKPIFSAIYTNVQKLF